MNLNLNFEISNRLLAAQAYLHRLVHGRLPLVPGRLDVDDGLGGGPRIAEEAVRPVFFFLS